MAISMNLPQYFFVAVLAPGIWELQPSHRSHGKPLLDLALRQGHGSDWPPLRRSQQLSWNCTSKFGPHVGPLSRHAWKRESLGAVAEILLTETAIWLWLIILSRSHWRDRRDIWAKRSLRIWFRRPDVMSNWTARQATTTFSHQATHKLLTIRIDAEF